MRKIEISEEDVTNALKLQTEKDGEREGKSDELEILREEIYSKLRFAIINAIPHEYSSILVVFGKPKTIPSRDNPDSKIRFVPLRCEDGNLKYVVVGEISSAGIAQAASAAAVIKYKCRSISKMLLVGIAAGQPDTEDQEKDVRLGDLVISDRIIQYDHVSRKPGEVKLRGDNLPTPDAEMLNIVWQLKALQEVKEPEGLPWEDYIDKFGHAINGGARPSNESDGYSQKRKYSKGEAYIRRSSKPYIHVGVFGSASTLLRDSSYRNELNSKHRTIAYEMESAGVAIAAGAGGFSYINIRGICDYGDEEKNDNWQRYAGLCAASFARCLLEKI
jgi:nucleoside phosphorylase